MLAFQQDVETNSCTRYPVITYLYQAEIIHADHHCIWSVLHPNISTFMKMLELCSECDCSYSSPWAKRQVWRIHPLRVTYMWESPKQLACAQLPEHGRQSSGFSKGLCWLLWLSWYFPSGLAVLWKSWRKVSGESLIPLYTGFLLIIQCAHCCLGVWDRV